MTWRYDQGTGMLYLDAQLVGQGYSGRGEGKNNPALASVPNTGPIPVGGWVIGPPFFSEKHGPYCLPLTPKAWQARWGFLVHGDSISHPGDASEGCIILTREVRQRIWNSGDHDLEVFYDKPAEVTA